MKKNQIIKVLATIVLLVVMIIPTFTACGEDSYTENMIAELQEQLAKLETENQTTVDSLTQQIEDLQGQLVADSEKTEAEKAELAEQIAKLQAQLEETKNNDKTAELEELIKKLQAELEAAKNDETVKALQAEIEKLLNQIKEAETGKNEVSAALAGLQVELRKIHETYYEDVKDWKFVAAVRDYIEGTADTIGKYAEAQNTLLRAGTLAEAQGAVDGYKTLLISLERVDATYINTLKVLELNIKQIENLKNGTDIKLENSVQVKMLLDACEELIAELGTTLVIVDTNDKTATDALVDEEDKAEKLVRIAIYEAIYGKYDGTTKLEDVVITKAVTAEGKYLALKNEFDALIATHTTKVQTFIDAVNSIGDVTYASKSVIAAAVNEYNSLELTAVERAAVVLNGAEYTTVKAIYDKLLAKQNEYNKIDTAIKNVEKLVAEIEDLAQYKFTFGGKTVICTGLTFQTTYSFDGQTDVTQSYTYTVVENGADVTKTVTLTLSKTDIERQYNAIINTLKTKVPALETAIMKVVGAKEDGHFGQDAAAIDATYTALLTRFKLVLAKESAFGIVDGTNADAEVKANCIAYISGIAPTSTSGELDCFEMIEARLALFYNEIAK